VVDELIFDPPKPYAPVTSARSTVLAASRASIAEAGHGPRYDAALDPAARAALSDMVAGSWIPLPIAAAHYRACDALGLSASAVATLGRSTNERVKGTLYGTFIRVFKETGGSPWNVLPHWQRFWHRGYDGGAVKITKLGPKDAQVDVFACSLCESHYFRNALRGLSAGFIEIFCERAYAQELRSTGETVSFRYQWA
jgi:hypothetical protein